MKKHLVSLPVGMGKTRLVWKNILRGECSRFAWNVKIRNTLILGPNPRVYRAWLRELLLYTVQRNLIKGSQDSLRELSVSKQEVYLERNGFSLPEFLTYSKLGKKKVFQKIRYLVLDEWHSIGGKIYDECDKFLDGTRTKRFYIGGRHVKSGIYFVSATPINPVLEEEDKKIDEHPLSDEEFRARITLGKEKALSIIKAFIGNKENHRDMSRTKFLDETKRLGFKLISGTVRGINWRIPEAAGQPLLHNENELRAKDLQAIKEILDHPKERRSYEHAYAVGLVRTHYSRHKKTFYIRFTQKGSHKNVFGKGYVTVYVPPEKCRKDAVNWLREEHSRLPRLLGTLKAEGVIQGKRGRFFLTKKKKAVVFCTHQGVSIGLTHALKAVFGQSYHHTAISNTIAPSAGDTKIEALSLKKDDLIERFNKKGPPYILIATDAFSESIDLHENCKVAIHYELPWSPLRLYQRIGRLTRIITSRNGVPRINSPVRIAHIILPGSVEEERVNRLHRRIAILKAEDIWPNHYSLDKLMAGLIGSGPSLHYNELMGTHRTQI